MPVWDGATPRQKVEREEEKGRRRDRRRGGEGIEGIDEGVKGKVRRRGEKKG